MPMPATRSARLVVRLTPAAKWVLTAAAAAERRSVSEFVLGSARDRAEETLALRRHFGLAGEKWDTFIAALDDKPRPLPQVKALFSGPSIFEDRPTKHR